MTKHRQEGTLILEEASKEATVLGAPRRAALSPTASGERIELLDIVRGFAVFGILLVNMLFFFAPIYLYTTSVEWWSGAFDHTVHRLIQFLAQGKFYSMFSFLFGVGAAVQLQRAEASGRRFGSFFARRMLWLLLIGLCHAILIWFGDILVFYALLGFVLILFARRSLKTLLVWSVILFLLPILLFGGMVGITEMARATPASAAEVEAALADSLEHNLYLLERARSIYATGSLAEIVEVRLGQWGVMLSFSVIWFPNILALFLVGLNLGRREILQNPVPHLPRLRRLIVWLVSVGLVTNLGGTLLTDEVDPGSPSPIGLVQQVCFAVGGPSLCFFYVFGITLLVQRETWRRRLAPLGAVGRMALTNYLMHSLVFTTMANSYGLGLYGRISPAEGLVLTVGMYVLQIPFSIWWLRRFRFGPAEWLWRSLTYGRPQPLWL